MNPPNWTRPVVQVMAVGVVAISALTLLGHALNWEFLADWNHAPGMAINTASALLLVGFSLLLIAWREEW